VKTRCRILEPDGVQCVAPAVEEDGEIQLCIRHLLAAMELLKANGAVVKFDTTIMLKKLT
jgi:hypothetical protein